MTFDKWYNFNCANNEFFCNFGDIFVKIFRKQSFNVADMITMQLLSPEDAVALYRDYIVFAVGKHVDHNGYCSVAVMIYKPETPIEAHNTDGVYDEYYLVFKAGLYIAKEVPGGVHMHTRNKDNAQKFYNLDDIKEYLDKGYSYVKEWWPVYAKS